MRWQRLLQLLRATCYQTCAGLNRFQHGVIRFSRIAAGCCLAAYYYYVRNSCIILVPCKPAVAAQGARVVTGGQGVGLQNGGDTPRPAADC